MEGLRSEILIKGGIIVIISDYGKLREYSRINKLKIEENLKQRIKVVVAKCSVSVGAYETLKAVQDTIKEEKIENLIVEITGCIGLCHAEPILIVEDLKDSATIYDLVTPEKASIITLVHGLYGQPIYPWTIKNR